MTRSECRDSSQPPFVVSFYLCMWMKQMLLFLLFSAWIISFFCVIINQMNDKSCLILNFAQMWFFWQCILIKCKENFHDHKKNTGSIELSITAHLDTVWYLLFFSIAHPVWELSLTQEECLCKCCWIMNFKQISKTFPLKQQTTYFQFPKKRWCVPPCPVSSSVSIAVCSTVVNDSVAFIYKKGNV